MATRILALFLALFVSWAAEAEEPVGPAQIGRLAQVSGSVAVRPGVDAGAIEAIVNTPLTTGNHIATEPRAHATVDIAAGRFYLDGNSAMTLGALGAGATTVTLENGAVILRILPGGAGQVFVIDTPRGKLRADQPGYFEVEVAAEAGSVSISALEGGAQFGESMVLPPGTRAALDADSTVLGTAVEDDFTRRIVAEVADAGENKLEAPTHVSPQASGFQELQRHGLWVLTEQYGWVWEPMVASDWAPLQDGRWVEISPSGRTWVDNASWGFTTAHYGSWAEVNGRWVWVPGDAGQATAGFAVAQSPRPNWVALGPEEPHPTSSPIIINTVRVVAQPSVPKIVNVTTVNNTTNVTTVVKEDRRPSAVFIGGQVPSPPTPTPPSPAPSTPRNLTGLGAAGTPISRGVVFPGQR
jgi:hypothetical protein